MSAPNFRYTYTSTDIRTIVVDVLDEVSFTLSAAVADDVFENLEPTFTINNQPYENLKGILLRLMGMTESYLRGTTGVQFEAVYPQNTDGIDETYYSDQAHWFYTYTYRRNLLIPNHFKVYGNRGADGEWTGIVTGEASDTDQINRYRDVTQHYRAAILTTQGQVDDRAASIKAEEKTHLFAGRLTVPHDARVQLLDRVQVISSRGYV